ncbi:MAG: hypothetical protein F4120_12105 [Rhodothermaceae bacterium]|nr:hypothetical protein [Rhodothermaceae bacterium]MXW33615.1 hypothetical protein [Rhodothermaceae bacterium]MYC05320.1 hypothetical protein [Rhodothermaceae bacterium]MYE63170.1 hypothetical protein [Rhodothermaceae bacterium]MYI18341.1 hypothetical protein [Rhodothermaceae bacterium]
MNVLSAPNRFKRDVNVWVDEAIWGHRFYNDQTPWLVFLEFLCIFRDRHPKGCALSESRPEGAHEEIKYRVPRLLPLRELVFNNPHIQHIETNRRSDSEKWSEWLNQINLNGYDFSFLQYRFGKFSRFAQVVEYFQNSAIEPHRQRRWTSRFIFPHGPDCLYADLPKNPSKSPDRRFFARGGELLYLMLCRSGHGPEIAKLINRKLLQNQDPWNRVAKALLPKDYDDDKITSHVGYLPYAEREEYKALAETWNQLLQLQLPSTVLFDPLVRLSSLHMLLYMLRRAAEEIGGEKKEPRFVLEIAAPSKTMLYELASESLQANRMSTLRAVHAHIDSAMNGEGWRNALDARVPAVAVRDFLKDRFSWKGAPDVGDPNDIMSELQSYAEKRHKQHVANVHNEWTRQIGLTVSQRRAGTWYAPSDSLLKALVMCIVEDGREDYHRFLAKLYERFCIVIAAPEAERAFGSLPTDQHAFTLNSLRLEQRLRTLGLLRRLSDDCAYVLNPFRRHHDSE